MIKPNQKLPLVNNGFQSIESISIIKDTNTSNYKIAELNMNSKERKYLKSRLPNIEDSGDEESDLSNYLMKNPALSDDNELISLSSNEKSGNKKNYNL